MPDPAENYQNAVKQPLPGDNDPVPLTRRQVQKAEAILSAYLEGQTMWAEALPDVVNLLKAAHLHDLVSGGNITGVPRLNEATQRLDTWPWPTPTSL